MKNKLSFKEIEVYRKAFLAMGCAQIYDSASKYCSVLDIGIKPLVKNKKLAGPMFPVVTENDMLPGLQGLDVAEPGWVITIKNNIKPSEALAGDIFLTAMKNQNLAGLVVDGAVRDIDFCQDIGIPIFANSVTFVSAKTAIDNAKIIPINITLGSVEIAPGDWFVGDSDGCLIIKSEYLPTVLKAATVLRKIEESFLERLNNKEKFSDITGLHDFLKGKGPLKFEV